MRLLLLVVLAPAVFGSSHLTAVTDNVLEQKNAALEQIKAVVDLEQSLRTNSLRSTSECQTAAAALITNPPDGCHWTDFSNLVVAAVGTNRSNTEYWCSNPCISLWIPKLETVVKACETEIAQNSATAAGNPQISYNLNSIVEIMCLKNNNGQYCLTEMMIWTKETQVMDPQTICDAIKADGPLGCCYASFAQYSVSSQADPALKAQQQKEVDENNKNVKRLCGSFPRPCNEAGAQFDGTITLSGLTKGAYDDMSSANKATTLLGLRADLAAKAQVSYFQLTASIMSTATRASPTVDATASFVVQSAGVKAADAAKSSLTTGPLSLPSVQKAINSTTPINGTVSVGAVKAIQTPDTDTATRTSTSLALLAAIATLVASMA